MIDTVIFDLGNVLVAFDWQKSLASYGFPREKYEAIADAMYRHADWAEMDRGVLTVEEVTARFISHAPDYAEDIRRLVAENGKTIYQYAYTKPLLRALKEAGLKVYYLSNYGKYGYEQTKEQLDFLPMMDGGLFSYEVKMVKPNPWIYAELLARYAIVPDHAVFFDDNPANVAAAEKMGLHGRVFTSVAQAAKDLRSFHLAFSGSFE